MNSQKRFKFDYRSRLVAKSLTVNKLKYGYKFVEAVSIYSITLCFLKLHKFIAILFTVWYFPTQNPIFNIPNENSVVVRRCRCSKRPPNCVLRVQSDLAIFLFMSLDRRIRPLDLLIKSPGLMFLRDAFRTRRSEYNSRGGERDAPQ